MNNIITTVIAPKYPVKIKMNINWKKLSINFLSLIKFVIIIDAAEATVLSKLSIL